MQVTRFWGSAVAETQAWGFSTLHGVGAGNAPRASLGEQLDAYQNRDGPIELCAYVVVVVVAVVVVVFWDAVVD